MHSLFRWMTGRVLNLDPPLYVAPSLCPCSSQRGPVTCWVDSAAPLLPHLSLTFSPLTPPPPICSWDGDQDPVLTHGQSWAHPCLTFTLTCDLTQFLTLLCICCQFYCKAPFLFLRCPPKCHFLLGTARALGDMPSVCCGTFQTIICKWAFAYEVP